MRATAEPAEGNRVRLSVEVDEEEINDVVDATARRLSGQLRVPGFRPGHVPRRVLEVRLGGASALRQQAIQDALPDFYARAVSDTSLDPIAAPQVDLVSGEDAGPLSLAMVVEVRPTISLPGYQGLAVTVPAVEVRDEEVDAQVDRIREQSGELVTVTRAARGGDHVTIDLHGTRPGSDDLDVEDYLYEVGSGSDVPGLDEQLHAAKSGDILQFTAPMPTAGGEAAGEEAGASGKGAETEFRVLVKEVKEKRLPEATDEWASEASEFDTVDELRADLRGRLEQMKRVQAQLALRDRALEALVELVEDEPPEALVDEEVRERLHDLSHRLEERRMTLDQFFEASGRGRDELLAEIRTEAVRDVRADLALRALADAEDIDVTDEELDEAVREIAEQARSSPDEVRRRLDRSGRLAAVRSGRRKAKALSWLLDHVELMDEEGRPVSRDDLRGDVAREEPTDSAADATTAGKTTVDSEVGERGSDEVRVEDETSAEAEAGR